MLDFYVHQFWGNGVGNFINCTPTIVALSVHYGESIPVLFDTKYVEDMFENSEYLHPITREEAQQKKALFSSDMVQYQIEEYKHIYNKISEKVGVDLGSIPHTHVPVQNKYKRDGKYVVVAWGCVENSAWKLKKDPGVQVYQNILDIIPTEYDIVIIGSSNDYVERLHKLKINRKYEMVLDDIQQSVDLVNGCDFMIANDTGMYHVAGALKKDIFVLWKDTPFVKNKTPSKKCFYSQKGNWFVDFGKWLKEVV
jgi:ADP-heptose:LPS heptosyltransferase